MTGPGEPGGPPRRVRVQRGGGRATRLRPGAGGRRDLHEQTQLGDLMIRSLMRVQLHLAIRVCALFGGLLGALPLVFAFVPQVRDLNVAGLPLPWLLLGVLVYPGLVAGAVLYVRQAERNEHEFEDLVDRS
ncbi:hypothetical protein [Actinomadura litoris]|uniref:DUF485 domain-containing protein n=1 Tax=Actinomadura litoris TaxID=2678616 RepID=A0A7K1L2I5_9ACTN|nr:hypothetical protein [Actinomadura litoris]MUN38597.1 hypothetical protein [Actinomadura litoris]